MKKISPGALAALLAAALLAAPAHAANVTVRVEGAAQTLLPRTPTTTTTTPVGQGRAATAPAPARWARSTRATAGDWAGTYFDEFSSWFVETIKGETHASGDAGYWALWINNVHSDLGLCGAETQEGDDVLRRARQRRRRCSSSSGLPATVAPGQA